MSVQRLFFPRLRGSFSRLYWEVADKRHASQVLPFTLFRKIEGLLGAPYPPLFPFTRRPETARKNFLDASSNRAL